MEIRSFFACVKLKICLSVFSEIKMSPFNQCLLAAALNEKKKNHHPMDLELRLGSVGCIQHRILPLRPRHTDRSLILSLCLFILSLYSRINTPARDDNLSFPAVTAITRGRKT